MPNRENTRAHWQKVLDRYTYRMTWSNGDDRCVGLCAESPSLSWLDATPEKALRGIRKVVAEVVADMQANDEPVPEPISRRRYGSGKFMVRVPRKSTANSSSKPPRRTSA